MANDKKSHPLQKFSLIMGWLSFLLAIISAIFLYLKTAELGAQDPVSASFLASMFFFICVGVLLMVMGKADIPDLKIRPQQKKD